MYNILEVANSHGGDISYLYTLIEKYSIFDKKENFGIKFQPFKYDLMAVEDYSYYSLYKDLFFTKKEWEEEFFKKYPIFSSMGRPLYSTEDDNIETSIETYLRGELLSYSEKTLELYLKYIIEMKEKNINLAIKNMDNLASMQGFKNSDEVEEYYKNLQKN